MREKLADKDCDDSIDESRPKMQTTECKIRYGIFFLTQNWLLTNN